MGIAKRIVFLVTAVLATTSLASADFTYNVSLSVENFTQEGGSAGLLEVNGTITVDKLGSLAASEITSYSLTFTSPDNPATTVTAANGEVVLFGGASLAADSNTLSVTLLATSSIPGMSTAQYFGIVDPSLNNVGFSFSDATQ